MNFIIDNNIKEYEKKENNSENFQLTKEHNKVYKDHTYKKFHLLEKELKNENKDKIKKFK